MDELTVQAKKRAISVLNGEIGRLTLKYFNWKDQGEPYADTLYSDMRELETVVNYLSVGLVYEGISV